LKRGVKSGFLLQPKGTNRKKKENRIFEL